MAVSPYLLLALTSLFWSFNFVIGKVVAVLVPPATISFLRWLVPVMLLLPFSWREIGSHWPAIRSRWPLILFLGATGYCLNSIAVYEAVRFTTTINTSFINAFNPVLIAVAGYVLYRNPITRPQLFGFMLSLAGVLCIVFQGQWDHLSGLRMNVGDLFMVFSIAIWSVHTVVYRRWVPKFPARAMFTLMMLGGVLATVPLVLIENAVAHWDWVRHVRGIHVLGILALSIFPSLLAYHFWNTALQRISANQVAIFLYLIPLYTTIISIGFLGEQFRAYHALGGLLIFVGVLLVTNRPPDATAGGASARP